MDGQLLVFKKLRNDATYPKKATPQSAGYDLHSVEEKTITNAMTVIKTGISVDIPVGYYGRIAMRSGLACGNNLCVSAGVIDRDYHGELMIAAYCTVGSYTARVGERIAQLIIEKIYEGEYAYCNHGPDVEMADENPHKGFGSTGKF